MNEITGGINERLFVVKHPCGATVRIEYDLCLSLAFLEGVNPIEFLSTVLCPIHTEFLPQLWMSSDEEFLKIWQYYIEGCPCSVVRSYVKERISELTS